jgi:hypothetical protein
MESYLSIAEAISHYGKSESTIRSIVRLASKKKGVLKHESLKNGSKKIYISIDYLDSKFKVVNNHSKGANDTLGNDTSNELIEVLKSQLLEKDKQINELIERSRESNILLSQMQQKVLMLDEPKKKKWWQRK